MLGILYGCITHRLNGITLGANLDSSLATAITPYLGRLDQSVQQSYRRAGVKFTGRHLYCKVQLLGVLPKMGTNSGDTGGTELSSPGGISAAKSSH